MAFSVHEQSNALSDALANYHAQSGVIACEWVRCNIVCGNVSVPLDVANLIVARTEPWDACALPPLNGTTPPPEVCAPCTDLCEL